jgi:hypothetical protein
MLRRLVFTDDFRKEGFPLFASEVVGKRGIGHLVGNIFQVLDSDAGTR